MYVFIADPAATDVRRRNRAYFNYTKKAKANASAMDILEDK